MNSTRCAIVLSMLFVIGSLKSAVSQGEEAAPTTPESETLPKPVVSLSTIATHGLDWTRVAGRISIPKIDLPRAARSSVARQPLRQVTLLGGDRFLGECLTWSASGATWRLLNGQSIQVPLSAIVQVACPPGEFDLIDESFEAGTILESDPELNQQLDDTQAADGQRSLRINSPSPYRRSFEPPLSAARVQFWFRTASIEETPDEDERVAAKEFNSHGKWALTFRDSESHDLTVTTAVSARQLAEVRGMPASADRSTQPLKLSDGWHSFVALISPERTRLIIDGASLASFPCLGSLSEIQFRQGDLPGTSKLWIDELQVQQRQPIDHHDHLRENFIDRDLAWTTAGDELFCRLRDVSRAKVTLENFGEPQAFPWQRLGGLAWRQPSSTVAQTRRPRAGVIAGIELQPFADRPDCPPDQWIVTILSADAKQLVTQHSLVGELTFAWSEIRRVTPQFYGHSLLVDARRFHLGNSIRADLFRHLPDGTEWQNHFELTEIPPGQPYVSLDVAEIEAASPDAPVASPFLSDLRAGKLLTDVFVNEQLIGDLNSQIRFKTTSPHPDHLRLPFSRSILKTGRNSLRMQQRSLNDREYDDGEISSIRVEFELD